MSANIYSLLESKSINLHYAKRYVWFIDKFNNTGGTIKHHILPKAKDMWPEYSSFSKHRWNKSLLTARQHFVAHKLLWKALGGSQIHAFWMMGRYNKSRDYESVRDDHANRMSSVIAKKWANRTEEEKKTLLDTVHSKTKEWYQTEEGRQLKEKLRNNIPKMVEGVKARDPEDRKRSARLGKERMGAERRKEVARKGVENRDPETEALARLKALETRANWTEEKRKEVFEKSSQGRKGKCSGSENGRARKIVAESRTFDTLKQAMLELDISEYKLHSRLKDPNNKEYYYV